MTQFAVLDSAGRRRSPATLPGYHAGRPPRNKGMRYPADPPTVEEIIAVMREVGADSHGSRVRGLIAVLWRGGLRIQEAVALSERDLDPRRGSILVRRGKGGRRREVGMDGWGFEQLRPWLSERAKLPVGPLFCVIDGPTRGRPWSAAGVRVEFRHLALEAGIRRRFAPHQLRHAHALELAREGVSLNIIQRQLGHANLGTTSIYLQGIDTEEIIAAVHGRRAPMMPASVGLRFQTKSPAHAGAPSQALPPAGGSDPRSCLRRMASVRTRQWKGLQAPGVRPERAFRPVRLQMLAFSTERKSRSAARPSCAPAEHRNQAYQH